MTKTPLAILAFNRSDYLEQTLRSLAGQADGALAGREIHLFQDGVVNPISGKRYAPDAKRDENIALFSKIFPNGTVHAQTDNVGIARHFDFIESYLFETRGFEAAMFFEDDLLLHSRYLEIMERLISTALANEKIGYVAAYGDHRTPLVDQLKNLSKITEMRHKWGFALTRRQWLRQRPFVQEYLALIADTDYQMRNGEKIVEWLISKKTLPGGTSQDGIKDAAMLRSGATKLMTFCCYGKYIGKTGVHSTEKLYGQEGFGSTELCTEVAADFVFPPDQELDRTIKARCNALADNVNRVAELFPSFRKKVSS